MERIADAETGIPIDHRADSYLIKPVDFDKFKKRLDDPDFYWPAWNRL